MTVGLIRTHSTGLAVSLMVGAFGLAAASHCYAAPQVGGSGVKPPGVIIPVGKSPNGRFFGSPTTIKPPPSPRVRDHRGEQQKLKPPPNYCFRGGCRVPKGAVIRDHRSK